jgi:hypothetical protein
VTATKFRCDGATATCALATNGTQTAAPAAARRRQRQGRIRCGAATRIAGSASRARLVSPLPRHAPHRVWHQGRLHRPRHRPLATTTTAGRARMAPRCALRRAQGSASARATGGPKLSR